MKIFVLLSRVPYPIEKGDKLRAYHHIRCLAQNHEIILCALSDSPVHPEALTILSRICSEVHIIPIKHAGMIWNLLKAFINGNPLQVGYFYRSSAQAEISKLIQQHKPDHIFCQLIRVSEYVKDQPIPKTLDYQDIFSMGAKRQAETAPFWKSPFLLLEYKRLLNYEQSIFGKFDHKCIISVPDRELLSHPDRNQVVIIPNGVDHDFFKPLLRPKKFDIVFTGNMGYPPNIDAAHFIAKDIFPLVLKKVPTATLLIAGATPHASVKSLQSGNINVSGWMPDIRESYAASRIFIAPMRIGTGLQNKLLEAMSMELPCITSPLANQALGAAVNQEILVGTSAGEYAGHIISLLQDEAKASTLAANGFMFVKQNFSWEKSAAMLEQLFNTHKIKNI
jgi:sugar transferase (PEP-CTERM/EpsH1 system associated)